MVLGVVVGQEVALWVVYTVCPACCVYIHASVSTRRCHEPRTAPLRSLGVTMDGPINFNHAHLSALSSYELRIVGLFPFA